MYEIQVESSFNAIHRLPLPNGDWEPLHGHDWHVTVTLRGPTLDSGGMLVDFHELEKVLKSFTARLHHTDLNENPLISHQPPSAEHVARVIYDSMCEVLSNAAKVYSVCVTEAPGCRASFVGED
jgi:6-pyruvoyltetrahydropterin/6-carboxytetrahydropterin synthase